MDWIMRGARIMFWLIFCAMIGDMDMLMRRTPVSPSEPEASATDANTVAYASGSDGHAQNARRPSSASASI